MSSDLPFTTDPAAGPRPRLAFFDPACLPRLAEEARSGATARLIARVPSGWALLDEHQAFLGACVLVADPEQSGPRHDLKARFMSDLTRLGEAVEYVTGCERVTYAILGGVEPVLHAHIFPRYSDEPEAVKGLPPWLAAGESRRFDPRADHLLIGQLRVALGLSAAA